MFKTGSFVLAIVLTAALWFNSRAAAQSPAQPAAAATENRIAITEALVIDGVVRSSRAGVFSDALLAIRARGEWKMPAEGDEITLPDGSKKAWRAVKADASGTIAIPAGGYGVARVSMPAERVMMLEAVGHSMVYVNGEPRTGDVYSLGFVRIPVLLRAGENELLFLGGRGPVRASLAPPKSDAMIDLADSTLPDLVEGEAGDLLAAVLVVNATNEWANNLAIVTRPATGTRRLERVTDLPRLAPLSVRKCRIVLSRPDAFGDAPVDYDIRIQRGREAGARALDVGALRLDGRLSQQAHRRTFVSTIDDSVQWFALVPPANKPEEDADLAAVLSLHGASVDALAHARSYAAKDWAYIIAPTNRRTFGFDWEDWGRIDAMEAFKQIIPGPSETYGAWEEVSRQDAMEALGQTQRSFRIDPSRVYVTGHSMGGHGAWHLATTYPDRFAAVGPSAGWISFATYGGLPEATTPLERMLARAGNGSDTLALIRNLEDLGVYILHGDADESVPVNQAERMRDELAKFHHDVRTHIQKGAAHWWDASDEPGVDCVDWSDMFEFFSRRTLPPVEARRTARFTTMNPSVSDRHRWASIFAQERWLEPSTFDLRHDPGANRITGTTSNVSILSLDISRISPSESLTITLDGQTLPKLGENADRSRAYCEKRDGAWTLIPRPAENIKGPDRAGPFKQAFRRRFSFVYGTAGTPEENARLFAKARYDAETFWYRGNGSVELVSDDIFSNIGADFRDRSVILFGNADTNRAWDLLLRDSPIQVRRGSVTIGEREFRGDNLACLFIRPRPEGPRALVGVVACTGAAGEIVAERLPYLRSGSSYPDFTLISSEMFNQGSGGLLGAGFFGGDWSLDPKQSAFAERGQR
jgi:poly(3-hydroxybutyrate) depolymerase